MSVPDAWRPTRQIELLAGTPPGGGQDRAARALAAALQPLIDQPMVVVNVPGLGGANAWARLEETGDDGHVLAISSPTLLTNPLGGVAEVGPDAVSQVALLCTEFIAFAVAADDELSSAGELIGAIAADTPPTVALATARGNVNHIALAMLCRHVGVDPRTVPVRVHDSAVLAIDDCLAGHADVVAVSAASMVPRLSAASLRHLAVSAPNRLEAPMDHVPTWEEDGVACTIGTWRGVVAPPRVSPDVISYWADAVAAAVAGETWREALGEFLWADTHLAGEALDRFVTMQEETMRAALDALGLLAG